jgi:hypothetical protein
MACSATTKSRSVAVAPGVVAHDEQPDPGAVPGLGLVRDEPAQEADLPLLEADRQRRGEQAEVQLARGPGLVRVRPRADDQGLVAPRVLGGGGPAQGLEVVQRPAEEQVEPAADVQRRDGRRELDRPEIGRPVC